MNWIKTTISKDKYKDIIQYGNVYIIHLEPEEIDDSISCYECSIFEEPDLDVLTADLNEWKIKQANRKAIRDKKVRMQEILKELADTDYLSLKAFEGEDMSEHPNWKEHRASLRQEYRMLEAQIQ